jgi:tetratricopeptide (TPR) repeat protein
VAEADKVLASHGVGRTTLLAVLTRANALFSLQQWDPAAAAYEQYLQEAGKDDSLRFAALENLGMVAEAKGDLPGAAKAFERMAQETPAYADRADLDRARVLAAAGKVDDARQLLVKFAESHKDSALLSQASMQLGRLGAK